MNNQKTNIRSFRYSDEVARILEGADGKALNEKFENLVIYSHNALPDIIKQKEYEQSYVDMLQEQQQKLRQEISTMQNVKRSLDDLQRRIKSIL